MNCACGSPAYANGECYRCYRRAWNKLHRDRKRALDRDYADRKRCEPSELTPGEVLSQAFGCDRETLFQYALRLRHRHCG